MSQPSEPPDGKSLWRLAAYALMVAGGIAAFLAIRHFGEKLAAPSLPTERLAGPTVPGSAASGPAVSESSQSPLPAKGDVLLHVLLALAAVVVVGRVLGRLFSYFRQPPVIGEVVAGILLGPSLLGRVAPQVAAYVLPQSVAPYLAVIAQLGVVLYMFIVGLELNSESFRGRRQATLAISHASIIVPFVLGALLALYLYPVLATAGVRFTVFALFLGVAMSVTAFPVLARILSDRRMTKTKLGSIAITCAAAADVTAWCLLAFVVGVARAELGAAFWVVAGTVGYIALMLLVVRPCLARFVPREGQPLGQGTMAVVFVGLLLSAVATELIGIHALFGAFLFGAVIPHDSTLARELTRKLEDFVVVLLLPAFFALTGMRTEIGLVSGGNHWLLCGLIILVATVGKFTGTCLAGRLTGLGWQEASALGVLMNTRGLMELIVLNIGLDLGVISPTLFAMLVLMALVTTLATTPILEWIPAARGDDS